MVCTKGDCWRVVFLFAIAFVPFAAGKKGSPCWCQLDDCRGGITVFWKVEAGGFGLLTLARCKVKAASQVMRCEPD